MSKFRASSLAVLLGLAAVALLLFVAVQDVEAGVIENLDEGINKPSASFIGRFMDFENYKALRNITRCFKMKSNEVKKRLSICINSLEGLILFSIPSLDQYYHILYLVPIVLKLRVFTGLRLHENITIRKCRVR